MQYTDSHYIRSIAGITSKKWTLLVLHVLLDGTRRYHEINEVLPELTQKVLTTTLRRLEGQGLVKRVVYPCVPPKVEYSLTELGESFALVLSSMTDWARENLDELVVAGELASLGGEP